MDRRKLFVRLANDLAAGWVVLGSALLLWAFIGEALTGGVAVEPQPALALVEPWVATTMLSWLVAALWTGLRSLWSDQ